MTGAGLPHSETPGSTLGCQLPGAYRRLPRPSSAPDAKASTVCPKKLEHNRKTRCSRSLCSSQNTNGKPTNNHHQTTRTRKTLELMRYDSQASPPTRTTPPTRQNDPKRPEDTNPETPQGAPTPVSSGPNSVPAPTPPRHPAFPLPETWTVLTRPA
jgi:hypothetical protein